MTKLSILILLISISSGLFAQKSKFTSDAMNTCQGAINIFDDGDYKLEFTGNKSHNSIEAYPSLSSIDGSNELWCSFVAGYSGELTFNATVKGEYLQMVVFQQEKNNICDEISTGIAEIKRLHTNKKYKTVGLDYQIGDGVLYTLNVKEGDKLLVLFATEKESEANLDLTWRFHAHKPQVTEEKIVDRRDDDFAPTFSIVVRDKFSQKPLIASLSIEGNKIMDGIYTGSDFFFNLPKTCELMLKCEVEGYFFKDITDKFSAFEDQEIVFELEQISAGKSIKIEDIEFKQGTSEIVESSEPKLKRLKDFLALNSNINIEIQGHVFALGDNSFAGQKVSEARAKRVMKYLIDNGISKSRISAVGYGNTAPVYAEPKFFYEEQANRRVEILVKE